MGCTRRTMSRTGAASGLLWKAGFGHVGGAVHPVGDGRPVLLGYGLDETAQAGTLADMEKRTSIRPGGDRGCRSRCRPAPQLTPGPGVAHPPHRLPQEVGGTPSGDGRCQRPRPTAGDSPSCPCSRGRAPPPWPDRSSNPGRSRRRVRPHRPGPCHPRLTRSSGPTGSCAGTSPGWMALRSPGSGRFPRCATRRRRQCSRRPPAPTHQGQHLVARVRPPRRIAQVQVMVNQ